MYAASSENGEPALRSLECVIGPRWVVTAHHGEIEVLEEFRERAEGGSRVAELDSPSFVAAVAEWVVASYFRAFEAIESELVELDSKVMSDVPTSVSDDLARLVELRRAIGTLRAALSHTVRSSSPWLIPNSTCSRPRPRRSDLAPSRVACSKQWMRPAKRRSRPAVRST